ncbi:MAG: MBL fold metallo-hydrolase, partial [Myxococcota bacterium]
DGALVVVAEARDEAHGEALLSLPTVTARHRALPWFELSPFGDVRRERELVLRLGGDPGDAFRAQQEAWRRGELQAAPEVSAILRFGRDMAKAPLDAWEVVPGLWLLPLRTPTLPPATHTNTFLIVQGDEAVFVEPASSDPDEIAKALSLVDALGVRVCAIAVTHHHPDHAPGAAAMQAAWNAPLYAHPVTSQLLGFEAAGLDVVPMDEGDTLALGGTDVLRAHFTPGHAPGHLCFQHLPSELLIAGDMVAGISTILIDPDEGDMNRYLAELDRLQNLDGTLIPAHGGWTLDGAALLKRTADHRRAREAKVCEALERIQPAALTDLVPIVYADVPKALHGLAGRSLLSHLLGLKAREEAVEADGRWRLSA